MNEREALRAVAALKNERPEWLPVLEATLVVAERANPYGGEFAGAWVLDELEQRASSSVMVFWRRLASQPEADGAPITVVLTRKPSVGCWPS